MKSTSPVSTNQIRIEDAGEHSDRSHSCDETMTPNRLLPWLLKATCSTKLCLCASLWTRHSFQAPELQWTGYPFVLLIHLSSECTHHWRSSAPHPFRSVFATTLQVGRIHNSISPHLSIWHTPAENSASFSRFSGDLCATTRGPSVRPQLRANSKCALRAVPTSRSPLIPTKDSNDAPRV